MGWDYEDDSCYDDDAMGSALQDEYERQQDEYREQEKRAKQFVSDLKSIMVALLKNFKRLSLDKEYVFRREGHFWIVGLEKPATIIEDSKGMSYIHQLLQNPHKEIPATQLANSDFDIPLGGQQKVVDRETITTCRKQIGQLDNEQEKEQIENYLKKATRPNSQIDNFPDERETARKAVSNAISRAINNIGTYKQDLYQYLKNTIRTGLSCIYTPDKKIDWEL